jgi:hypothetical protein
MAFNGTQPLQMTVIKMLANQIDIILRGSLVQADQPNRRAGSKCCFATNMIVAAISVIRRRNPLASPMRIRATKFDGDRNASSPMTPSLSLARASGE